MKKIAILFAGQGSQYIGMGKDFYQEFAYIQNIYEQASNILGYDLKKLCFMENDEINKTKYTQPAVLVTSLAIYHTLISETKIKPDVFCGFSLGEYSALYASGIFNFNDIIYLVNKRAIYMDECSNKYPGKMAAIIGINQDILKDICDMVSKDYGVVTIANYNSPNQFVIGGLKEAVERASEIAKNEGAKKVISLKVSGAFHTPLMNEAANKMYEEIIKVAINKPKVKVIMNATGDFVNVEELPLLMKKQIASSVYFTNCVKRIIDDGVDTFIEIGPGKVLSGLVKKIDKTKEIISINNISDLERVKI